EKRYNRSPASRCKQRNDEKGQGHISHQARALGEEAKYESKRDQDTDCCCPSRPDRVVGSPDRVPRGEHLRCIVARETISEHHGITQRNGKRQQDVESERRCAKGDQHPSEQRRDALSEEQLQLHLRIRTRGGAETEES